MVQCYAILFKRCYSLMQNYPICITTMCVWARLLTLKNVWELCYNWWEESINIMKMKTLYKDIKIIKSIRVLGHMWPHVWTQKKSLHRHGKGINMYFYIRSKREGGARPAVVYVVPFLFIILFVCLKRLVKLHCLSLI